MLFHPVDNTHTSISSWIITTSIDFTPYELELDNVFTYAKQIRDYLSAQIPIYYGKDPKYFHPLNLTLNDVGLAIVVLKTLNQK